MLYAIRSISGMDQPIQLSHKIWESEPHFLPMFDHYKRFECEDAIDWFLRGSPDGESVLIPGIMGLIK